MKNPKARVAQSRGRIRKDVIDRTVVGEKREAASRGKPFDEKSRRKAIGENIRNADRNFDKATTSLQKKKKK